MIHSEESTYLSQFASPLYTKGSPYFMLSNSLPHVLHMAFPICTIGIVKRLKQNCFYPTIISGS